MSTPWFWKCRERGRIFHQIPSPVSEPHFVLSFVPQVFWFSRNKSSGWSIEGYNKHKQEMSVLQSYWMVGSVPLSLASGWGGGDSEKEKKCIWSQFLFFPCTSLGNISFLCLITNNQSTWIFLSPFSGIVFPFPILIYQEPVWYSG